MTHKILIELDDEAYEYWKARAEREERSMQSLISSMVNLFPKAKMMTDRFFGRGQIDMWREALMNNSERPVEAQSCKPVEVIKSDWTVKSTWGQK